MFMKNTLIAVSLLINVAILAQAPLEATPFQLVDQLMFIQVQVNGSRPLNFLFDTGAGVTVIDRAVAGQLGLKVSAVGRLNTAGKTVRSAVSDDNNLQIGVLSIDNISLEIIPLSHLSQVLFHPVDGVIGYDLLQRFVIKTDADTKMIQFYDPAGFTYHGAGTALDMIDMEHGHFGALVTFDLGQGQENIRMPLKFDTGYSDCLTLNHQAVQDHELIQKNKRYREVQGVSADTTVTINYRSKVKKVSLAGKTWRRVPTVLHIDKISIAATEKSRSDGLIGQELLLDFNIVYDYPRRMLYLEERR